MNPSEYPEVLALAPYRQKAQAQADRAATAETDLAAAIAATADAKKAHGIALTAESGETYLAAVDHERRQRLLAEAVADAGGPAGARMRVLHCPAVYAILADGFARREAEIAKLLATARKAVSAEIGALVDEGLNASMATIHPSVIPLRQRAEALAGQAQAALQDRFYTSASPLKFERNFDELFSPLVAPLS